MQKSDKPVIAYTCSYIPLEIIHAAGYQPFRLIGTTEMCTEGETGLSRTICPYVHAILHNYQEHREDIVKTVITDSCDGMKKLHDVFSLEEIPAEFISIPRQVNDFSIKYLAGQYKLLYENFCRDNSRKPDKAQLEESLAIYDTLRSKLEELRSRAYKYADFFTIKQELLLKDPEEALTAVEKELRKPKESKYKGSGIPVLITGSPMPGAELLSIIEEAGFSVEYNDSCLDARWTGLSDDSRDQDIFSNLARRYLSKIPCARMYERKEELEQLSALYPETVKGIIHIRMPFCDLYGFDLVHFFDALGKDPVLSIETDGTPQSAGQVKTRVEAFAEILSQKQKADFSGRTAVNNGSYYCGIDIGSTTVDGVILDHRGRVCSQRIIKTGPGSDKASENLMDEMLDELSLSRKDIAGVIATGYGRDSLNFADDRITEITCHARGVLHLLPEIRFVIDIGGQDSKVIKIGDDGKVQAFQMNDKCAAGTGRFLEVMAGALDIDLPMMTDLGKEPGETVPISSVCTVFAESEVISLMGKGHTSSSIVKGIYRAITNRLEGMVRRIGFIVPAAVTGGGALNKGLVKTLESRLDTPLSVPEYPQIVGAVGAALFAMDSCSQRTKEAGS